MNNTVVQSLPAGMRALFVELIGKENPNLLASLTAHEAPAPEESVAVHDILSTEFSRNLDGNSEPTERGKAIDNLLGVFLRQWPVQGEWFRRVTGSDAKGDG